MARHVDGCEAGIDCPACDEARAAAEAERNRVPAAHWVPALAGVMDALAGLSDVQAREILVLAEVVLNHRARKAVR